MAETITVTVPQLPALVGDDTDDLIAVWRGDGLGRVSRSLIRGTRTFTGPSGPPIQPSEIVALNPALGDRWRNTVTGDEWKVAALDPFTWEPDGNVKGAPGETTATFLVVTAAEALPKGALVNLFPVGGVTRARKADSLSASGAKKTDGYALVATDQGDPVAVYRDGVNDALSGLSPGLDYYMGPSGTVTATEPTASGQTAQYVGKALSATALAFQPRPFVGRA